VGWLPKPVTQGQMGEIFEQRSKDASGIPPPTRWPYETYTAARARGNGCSSPTGSLQLPQKSDGLEDMTQFKLLGHVCPEGTYPSVVLPVGAREDARIVVFISRARRRPGRQEQTILSDRFVKHGAAIDGASRTFRHTQHHRLFAYSPVDVVFFGIHAEAEFFLELPFRSKVSDR